MGKTAHEVPCSTSPWRPSDDIFSPIILPVSRQVPFADNEELVKNGGLPATMLVEVGNYHRLADPEQLEVMLKACVSAVK